MMGQSRLNITDTRATLGTRHRTKTNKAKNTTQKTNVEFVRIVAAILKMATGSNFSMSGINSGHHNLPTYEMSLKSDNVEFLRPF
jgi:hypothetical protein